MTGLDLASISMELFLFELFQVSKVVQNEVRISGVEVCVERTELRTSPPSKEGKTAWLAEIAFQDILPKISFFEMVDMIAQVLFDRFL